MSLKILHTADWHFRGKDLEEIEKCVRFIVTKAREEKPNLIVVSGDITDSRSLQLESKAAQVIFQIISEMLDIAPVAIVTGTPSHDGKTALALRSCKGKYPILVSDMPGQFGYYKHNLKWYNMEDGFFTPFHMEPNFIITQIPTPTKQYFVNDMNVEDSDNAIAEAMGIMFAGFGQHAGLYKGVPHIANGHISVGGAFISETQQLIGRDIEVSRGQLETLNADVVCLGHIHKAQQIGENIFYAGSPARMNHGEKEEKGFYIHTLVEYENPQELDEYEFIQTPARNLLEIKEDYTKPASPSLPDRRIENIFADEELRDASLKITFTMWQDEAATINQAEIEKSFLDAGCHDVKLLLIRKPRETVRSEKVLEAETLPDKLEAMAELRGENIDTDVIRKAGALESGMDKPWIIDGKIIVDYKIVGTVS